MITLIEPCAIKVISTKLTYKWLIFLSMVFVRDKRRITQDFLKLRSLSGLAALLLTKWSPSPLFGLLIFDCWFLICNNKIYNEFIAYFHTSQAYALVEMIWWLTVLSTIRNRAKAKLDELIHYHASVIVHNQLCNLHRFSPFILSGYKTLECKVNFFWCMCQTLMILHQGYWYSLQK
jgi:hypothetical protein